MSETVKIPSGTSAFSSRRQFIQLAIAAVGAAWAGTWVQSKLFPSQNTAQEAKPVVIPLSELPVGSAKPITYGGVSTLVLRTPESIKAFSLVCTHLGCLVQWQEGAKEFYCPCHDGRYDQFGEVTAGPPPVPLEQFPVRLEGDQVIVGEAVSALRYSLLEISMKKFLLVTTLLIAMTAILIFARPMSSAQALPEYSALTGEPCATCHISPSGGGPRGPRGQAWVGSGKPGAVPDLAQSLEALGVHLQVDQGAYTQVPDSIPPAQALPLKPGQAGWYYPWLAAYQGN